MGMRDTSEINEVELETILFLTNKDIGGFQIAVRQPIAMQLLHHSGQLLGQLFSAIASCIHPECIQTLAVLQVFMQIVAAQQFAVPFLFDNSQWPGDGDAGSLQSIRHLIATACRRGSPVSQPAVKPVSGSELGDSDRLIICLHFNHLSVT